MKISVLMPSYNDAESIIETLDSLIAQTYKDWQLIIIDDGSSDNTEEVVASYKRKKDLNNQIQYIKQTNQDQLNAIKNGCQYINGDYVYILHSDDLLADKYVFQKAINYLNVHKDVDAIIADLILIDKDSNQIGIQKVRKYENSDYLVSLQLLFLGRNLFVDFAFHRKQSFMKNVYENYLNWNGPFWLDTKKGRILNIHKVDFNFIKYRVFEGNYINNEIGLLNVINGELRVVTNLLKLYNIPFYKLQYYMYALLAKLKLGELYRPIYQKKETKNKYQIIKFVLNKRIPQKGYLKYENLNSILLFFKNYQERSIYINEVEQVYLGSDMRTFNKNLVNGTLSKFYYNLFDEMKLGFNEIIVPNDFAKDQIYLVLKFLGIDTYVKVKKEQQK